MGCYSRYIFPWLLDKAMRAEPLRARRRRTLAPASGRILEIGAGTGVNFEFYPDSVRSLETLDNNEGVQRRAARSAASARRQITAHLLSAERLPFDDESFDSVVSTFTLCSIADVNAALSEVRRILKPGGQFLFLEHGQARETNIARWQRRIEPIQKVIADGCHLTRDIRALVSDSGLVVSACREGYMPKMPRVLAYLYEGRAQKVPLS